MIAVTIALVAVSCLLLVRGVRDAILPEKGLARMRAKSPGFVEDYHPSLRAIRAGGALQIFGAVCLAVFAAAVAK